MIERFEFTRAHSPRVLIFIGRAAEYVHVALCRKAVSLLGEATAWCDARDAAWRRAQASGDLTTKNNQSRYHKNNY